MIAVVEGVDANGSLSIPIEEARALRLRIAQLEAEATDLRSRASRQGEEIFRLMADAAPVMIWTSDPGGERTYCNKLWLAFRGRTLEQELGRGWMEGIHPEDRERCVQAYLRAAECRREFRIEYRLERAGGEYRWVSDAGMPRCERDGAFAGLVGSTVDIHEQRADPAAAAVPLTAREKQVLVLIAEGNTTKETAALLGISYKTADSHRSKIMEKLGVHETASLVRYAIRHNLVRP